MGISKIYVNDNLRLDLTQTTATANDVAVDKKFFNAKGDLVTGSKQPAWFDFDNQNKKIILHLEDKFLDVPELIRDQWEFVGNADYYTYDIYINKHSYIPNYACYHSEGHYNFTHFICTEPMTLEDIWNCIEDPINDNTPGSSNQGRWIPCVNMPGGDLITDEGVALPNWKYIPRYSIEIGFNSEGINKVILPAEVEFIETLGYQIKILKCLRETPPEINSDALNEAWYIEVPVGCKDVYKEADGWCNYASCIYEVGEPLLEF